MAKKEKVHSSIDFHRAYLAQLDINLDAFKGKCQQLDIDAEGAFEKLRGDVKDFIGDVEHYITNFRMTDGIVNVNKNGKPALRGNQALVEEQEFFRVHAKQTVPLKRRPFIPYKEFARKVLIENIRREKTGEKPLKDIASVTYESWKYKFK